MEKLSFSFFLGIYIRSFNRWYSLWNHFYFLKICLCFKLKLVFSTTDCRIFRSYGSRQNAHFQNIIYAVLECLSRSRSILHHVSRCPSGFVGFVSFFHRPSTIKVIRRNFIPLHWLSYWFLYQLDQKLSILSYHFSIFFLM